MSAPEKRGKSRLESYIRRKRRDGLSDEEIAAYLIAAGWNPGDLESVGIHAEVLESYDRLHAIRRKAQKRKLEMLEHKYNNRNHFYSRKLQDTDFIADPGNDGIIDDLKKQNEELATKLEDLRKDLKHNRTSETGSGDSLERQELLSMISQIMNKQHLHDMELMTRRSQEAAPAPSPPRYHIPSREDYPDPTYDEYDDVGKEKPVVVKEPAKRANQHKTSSQEPSPQIVKVMQDPDMLKDLKISTENVTVQSGNGNSSSGGDMHEQLSALEQRFSTIMSQKMDQSFQNPVVPEAVQLVHEPVGDRAQTGVRGLDPIISGGFKRKTTTMVAGGPGTGKSTLGIQFIHNGVTRFDEHGIYITFEQQEEDIIETGNMFGFDLRSLVDQRKMVIQEYTPEQLNKMIKSGGGSLRDLIESIGAYRIVIDSITAFMLLFEGEIVQRKACLELFHSLSKWGCTIVAIVEEEYYSGKHESSVLEYEADGVIILYNERRGDVRLRSLEIFKMRDTKHAGRVFPMRITSEGIVVYPEQSF